MRASLCVRAYVYRGGSGAKNDQRATCFFYSFFFMTHIIYFPLPSLSPDFFSYSLRQMLYFPHTYTYIHVYLLPSTHDKKKKKTSNIFIHPIQIFGYPVFFFNKRPNQYIYIEMREKERERDKDRCVYVYKYLFSRIIQQNPLQCLVNVFLFFTFLFYSYGFFFFVLVTQRSSISPAEREKFRVRSSPDIEPHKKVKKEEKDCHVSFDRIRFSHTFTTYM